MEARVYVTSPLQILFAIEALTYLKVKHSCFILIKEDPIRYEQLVNTASFYGLTYEVCDSTLGKAHKNIQKTIRKRLNLYDYVLFGNYYSIGFIYSSIPLLKKKGSIIFLDDGTQTISILKGQIKENIRTKIYYSYLNWICKIRGIDNKTYFTIFSEIKTKRFNIVKNNFTCLASHAKKCGDNVFIIGTNHKLYCERLGIPLDEFYLKLQEMLVQIKSKCNDVIYIPHGRDNDFKVKRMCEDCLVEYRKIDTCVELYFVLNEIYPKAVYGFSSTALFTLKKLFPISNILNVYYGGQNKNEAIRYEEFNSYFRSYGIPLYERL